MNKKFPKSTLIRGDYERNPFLSMPNLTHVRKEPISGDCELLFYWDQRFEIAPIISSKLASCESLNIGLVVPGVDASFEIPISATRSVEVVHRKTTNAIYIMEFTKSQGSWFRRIYLR
jgi:hypothetical protein